VLLGLGFVRYTSETVAFTFLGVLSFFSFESFLFLCILLKNSIKKLTNEKPDPSIPREVPFYICCFCVFFLVFAAVQPASTLAVREIFVVRQRKRKLSEGPH
jgi:hypothetical protein